MSLTLLSKNLPELLGITPNSYIIAVNQPDNYFGLLADLPNGVKFFQEDDNMRVDSIHIFAFSQQELIHELFITKPLLKDNGVLWLFYPKKASRIRTDLDVNFIINFGRDIHLTNVQLIDFDNVWTGIEFRLNKYE